MSNTLRRVNAAIGVELLTFVLFKYDVSSFVRFATNVMSRTRMPSSRSSLSFVRLDKFDNAFTWPDSSTGRSRRGRRPWGVSARKRTAAGSIFFLSHFLLDNVVGTSYQKGAVSISSVPLPGTSPLVMKGQSHDTLAGRFVDSC